VQLLLADGKRARKYLIAIWVFSGMLHAKFSVTRFFTAGLRLMVLATAPASLFYYLRDIRGESRKDKPRSKVD